MIVFPVIRDVYFLYPGLAFLLLFAAVKCMVAFETGR